MSQVIEPRCSLIVIGGSAGAIPVIRRLLADLPVDLAAPILIVVHQADTAGGGLANVLLNRSGVPKGEVADGQALRPGHVYVAPPDHHLLIEPGHLRLSNGPRENGYRPAIDALFRTAAASYGPQVVAALLSGYLDDGTMGLLRVHRAGGVTIAQDPADAEAPDMPANAIRFARPQHVLPGDAIAPLLTELTGRRRDASLAGPAIHIPVRVVSDDDPTALGTFNGQDGTDPVQERRGADGSDTASVGDDGLTRGSMPGTMSGITCPGCGGLLWENEEGGMLRYQCHVGHRYSVESMRAAKDSEVETALWAALRALQERAALYWRLAEKASRANAHALADRYREHAEEAESRAGVIRRVVVGEPLHT